MVQPESRALYAAHRERLLARLAPEGACALFFSGSARVRNHDSEHRFRPESDFWYLTGFDEPEAALLLVPAGKEARSVLFTRPRSRDEEVWSGRRLGVEAAPAALGVDQCFPIAELWTRLPELVRGHDKLVYRASLDEARDRNVIALLAKVRPTLRNGTPAPVQWIDPLEYVHELRLFKDAGELALMRRAAALSAEAHVAAMRSARPGGNEREIDAQLSYTFARGGGSGAAYTNIVAGGANACILHYIENDKPLVAGELLLIDAGAEFDYYASDVTRTFPIGGRFTTEQRALYELVLDAQRAAMAQARPGARFTDVHAAALRVLVEGLVQLGLLKETAEAALESGSYRRFFMHRTSHWLGLDVHDCGAYHREGVARALEPGMVLTVEPGLYIAPDDDSVEARWRGLGLRIEDDLAITAEGHENLTAAIPKQIDELERLCSGRAPERAGTPARA